MIAFKWYSGANFYFFCYYFKETQSERERRTKTINLSRL